MDDKKDKQREHCGCLKCNDIGAYNTCMHKCKYCYATFNNDIADKNLTLHNPNSSVLIGELGEDVKVYEVETKKGKKKQPTLFDEV